MATRNTNAAGENSAPEHPRCRKHPSSKYKGVVPQANGRWGAQIYESNHRVWLGTFNLEEEAARAYDVASQSFRGHNAVTNFNPLSATTPDGCATIEFLSSHSKAEVVDMLRKHTYLDELEESKRSFGTGGRVMISYATTSQSQSQRLPEIRERRELLFEKVVTPSDAGKLNRLVIPKQYAEKNFPIPTPPSENRILLNFEDPHGKVWRFRYSFWESSQSYVLTKGWSRFVKERKLRAGDAVCFQRSSGPDGQLYIDWRRKNEINFPSWMEGGRPIGIPISGQGTGDSTRRQGQVLRLFGVDVCT